MERDKILKAEVRAALDECLSYVDDLPSLRYDIMQKARGEKPMKKKLSVGLIFAIVLILAAVTALAAITLNSLYEKTIEQEGQSGLIQDWSTEEKIQFVDWMVEVGVELDEDQVARLHDSGLSKELQATLAMEIISGYYPARDGILTAVDIIAKEKGPIEYWSLEDKAWFSELMGKYQPEEVGGVNLLPTKEDITQQQAIEIMYAYYEKEYGLIREDFDESKMSISFSENTWDDGTGPERLTTWGMNLWLKAYPRNPMGISILPDGTIKQVIGPPIPTWRADLDRVKMADDFWTVEGLYRLQQEWEPKISQIIVHEDVPGKDFWDLYYLVSEYGLGLEFGLPKAGDITRDEAYAIARDAILASGFGDTYLDYYGTREAYLVDDTGDGIYKFAFTCDEAYPLGDTERQEVDALHEKGLIPWKIIACIRAADGAVVSVEEDDTFDGPSRFGI